MQNCKVPHDWDNMFRGEDVLVGSNWQEFRTCPLCGHTVRRNTDKPREVAVLNEAHRWLKDDRNGTRSVIIRVTSERTFMVSITRLAHDVDTFTSVGTGSMLHLALAEALRKARG